MACDESCPRLTDTAKLLFDKGDEFRDERLTPRPIVVGIGKDMVSKRAARIENDIKHLDAIHVGKPLGPLRIARRSVVRAAEPGNRIDHGEAAVRAISKAFG